MSSAGVSPSRLEKMCMDLLQNTLCLPTNPEQLQVLCAAILREMSPFDDLALSCDHTQNTRQLSLAASVLLAQVTQVPPLRVPGGRGWHLFLVVLGSQEYSKLVCPSVYPVLQRPTLSGVHPLVWSNDCPMCTAPHAHTPGLC